MIKIFAALIVVTAQLLDFEKNLVFFTSGDAFRVASNARIAGPAPAARRYVRATFDDAGRVVELDVSLKKFPAQGDLADVHRFAVAMSAPVPNPDLAPKTGAACAHARAGRFVTVSISVQVPPATPLTDTVYMTSDQSGWNAQAYRMDRIDPQHYRTQVRLQSGTQMQVLFDRGSLQSVEAAPNGIEEKPHLLCVGDEDAQAFTRTVYHWIDENSGGLQTVPQALPTPYNAVPFPNLPTPHPALH
ncbi:MAG TPA: hypothetical protein VFL13_06685 [Candidatus Baltobacteraceae bacterium]|nr:hypothetical protein [Candidatus Baltobacteraceae bacterium]